MLKAILFDLDGTLLPMVEKEFLEGYFGLLTKTMEPRGLDGRELIGVLWRGVAAMVANDGKRTNEPVFREVFARAYPGRDVEDDLSALENFYRTAFDGARVFCGYSPAAGETVSELKRRGFSLILASNPVFPRFAQETRLIWAGIDPGDFRDGLCRRLTAQQFCDRKDPVIGSFFDRFQQLLRASFVKIMMVQMTDADL